MSKNKAFDAWDQSGGGGFNRVSSLHKNNHQTSTRKAWAPLWFWQIILDLEKRARKVWRVFSMKYQRKTSTFLGWNSMTYVTFSSAFSSTESSGEDTEVLSILCERFTWCLSFLVLLWSGMSKQRRVDVFMVFSEFHPWLTTNELWIVLLDTDLKTLHQKVFFLP